MQFINLNIMEQQTLSLYEYLGQAAGSTLGKQVYEAAVTKGVQVTTHNVSTRSYSGKILRYPKEFLNEYFAKLYVDTMMYR